MALYDRSTGREVLPSGELGQQIVFTTPGGGVSAFRDPAVQSPGAGNSPVAFIDDVELGDPRIDIAFRDTGTIGGGTNGEVLPQHLDSDLPAETIEILESGEGIDLRDLPGGDIQAGAAGGLAVGVTITAARALLRAAMAGATRITRAHWNRLPGWAQSLLAGVGLGVGIDLALDVPGIPGESIILGGGGGDGEPHFGPHLMDGHLGVTVVGQWVANGVRFYRLSDGKLAVQNKQGRWKVWRPKKPIVIMPGGATNLKTLLRADAVLNRQAKRIASMLNRRAPRPRKGSKTSPAGPVIIQSDGRVVNS